MSLTAEELAWLDALNAVCKCRPAGMHVVTVIVRAGQEGPGPILSTAWPGDVPAILRAATEWSERAPLPARGDG